MVNLFGFNISFRDITIASLIIGIIGVLIGLVSWRFPRRISSNENKRSKKEIITLKDDIKALESEIGLKIYLDRMISAVSKVFDPFSKGVKLMKEHRWDTAILELEKSIKEAEGRRLVSLYNVVGVCYYAKGKVDLAIKYLYRSVDFAKDCRDMKGEKAVNDNIHSIYTDKEFLSRVLKSVKRF